MTKTKFEAMDILNEYDIPCGPILSMKELAEEQSLRATGTIVEVDHPTRGKYLSVGNPIKLSDSARGDALAAAGRAHRRDLAHGAEVGRRAGGPGIGIRRARRRTASSSGVEKELPAIPNARRDPGGRPHRNHRLAPIGTPGCLPRIKARAETPGF